MVVPSDLTPIDSTCSLSFATATCALNTQTFTITNFNDFSSSIIVTFDATATYFDETGSFSLTLDYDGSIIATNTVLTVLRYCTLPCKQCTSTQTQCLSCLPSPHSQNNTYFPDNSSCVIICPATYYLNSDQCSKCNQTACYEC